jgi:ABC-type sugar transport system ATPase subunit
VLGIRPEHIQLQPIAGAGPAAKLAAQLNVIEPLGNDMDLYLSTPYHGHIVSRVEAYAGLSAGGQAEVYVDLRKVHFFRTRSDWDEPLQAVRASPCSRVKQLHGIRPPL